MQILQCVWMYDPKANAILHVQSLQCVVYCPWRYYRPTFCEPGTVWPYQLTMGKSLSQKNGKKKNWRIKTVFEGQWIYSVSGIPRQNENKNKMVRTRIEPGSLDSQANALIVTPRYLHVYLISFHCIYIISLSHSATVLLRVDNHWIKHNWFDLWVQPGTQTWVSRYTQCFFMYQRVIQSMWQT